MNELVLEVGSVVALGKPEFDALLAALQRLGYQTIGPRVHDNAICYETIQSLDDLPRGYTSEQDAGHYRLVYSGHPRYFDITPAAPGWKQFLFPPRSTLFTLKRKGKSWSMEHSDEVVSAYAFIGVRPCDLAAILVQDRVFLRQEWSDPIYRTRRQDAFILSVNCLHPDGTCFCDSMGAGPKAERGFDLNMTELEDVFLIEVGSEAGRMVMSELKCLPASAFLLQAANRGIEDARKRMGRVIQNREELPKLLNRLEHPQWDDVASRCLSCTSCTQVCPTCFCWDVSDQPDLLETQTRRERAWDSCFNPDYSYIAGGNTRTTTRVRYRQWLVHKLASWQAQFDVPGCVGCGRCITWCPAGIDITAEAAALLKEAVQ